MPYKKYKRKPRRRRRKNYKVKFNDSSTLLGSTHKVKFRYTENIYINPAAGGTVGAYVFSANGMYDPNITGVGHQPRGFDQLVGVLYNHYTVIASKITVWYTPDPTNAPVNCILALKDSNTTYGAPTDYTEMRNSKQTIVLPGAATKVMTMSFSAKKFLGVTSPLSEKDISGTSGANPVEQAFYHIGVADLNAGDLGSQALMVEIDYIAVLTEPKNPVAS